MLRVRADFNELNAIVDDLVGVVYFEDRVHHDFIAQAHAGQRVLLYQDEDDFEVEGVVGCLNVNGRDVWYARPDWSTFRRLP